MVKHGCESVESWSIMSSSLSTRVTSNLSLVGIDCCLHPWGKNVLYMYLNALDENISMSQFLQPSSKSIHFPDSECTPQTSWIFGAFLVQRWVSHSFHHLLLGIGKIIQGSFFKVNLVNPFGNDNIMCLSRIWHECTKLEGGSLSFHRVFYVSGKLNNSPCINFSHFSIIVS